MFFLAFFHLIEATLKSLSSTKDFKELVGDCEANWEDLRVIHVKNMEEVETFLFDPRLDQDAITIKMIRTLQAIFRCLFYMRS